MKKTLLFLPFIAVCILGSPQVPYYDALTLNGKISTDLGNRILLVKEVRQLLMQYYPGKTEDQIDSTFLSKNPFFKNLFKDLGTQFDIAKNFIPASLSKLGGLDVTKYANAIADIMIERAKQELTIAFFNRFKKFAEDNPEFEILFPKTTDNLSNLLTYTYPQMLPALRNGFFEDIKQITYHLDDVLELPRYQRLLENFPEVKVAIRSVNLVHELESKSSNAADIIKGFASFKEWADINTNNHYTNAFKNFGASVKLGKIFSESLREQDTSLHTIWVTMDDVKKMLQDQMFFNIYMGLIYQECKINEIKFYLNNSTLEFADDVLAKQRDNLLIFQAKITEFITLGNRVSETLVDIKSKQTTSNQDIYNYINVSIDVVEYAQGIAKIFDRQLISDDYLLIAKKSNSLYKDIYSEEYTQAVNDAIDILSQVHYLIKNNSNSGGKDSSGRLLTDSLGHLLTFVEKVKPYALFMANMVEAKSESQVKAALENVILPVGSSTVKKNATGWGNISAQSYLGAYWNTSSSVSNSVGSWTDKFGVIAPIGISWTPGFLSLQRNGCFSLFFSAFDLGAIVDYKLKKDSTIASDGSKEEVISKDYKVQLGQILSPGAYIVYGFPWNLPLSLGFGAQYGPGLSKIDAGNKAVVANPSVRWNAFLAVDIPLFNIKNHVNSKQ